MEMRWDTARDGKPYQNRHFATVAQAKAFRNAIEHVLPQDVVLAFVNNILEFRGENKNGKTEVGGHLQDTRAKLRRYATSNGITIDVGALERQPLENLAGLGDAARAGRVEFIAALTAAGLFLSAADAPPPKQAPKAAGAPAARKTEGQAKADQRPAQADPDPAQSAQKAAESNSPADQSSQPGPESDGKPLQIAHDATPAVDIGLNAQPKEAAHAGRAKPEQSAFGMME